MSFRRACRAATSASRRSAAPNYCPAAGPNHRPRSPLEVDGNDVAAAAEFVQSQTLSRLRTEGSVGDCEHQQCDNCGNPDGQPASPGPGGSVVMGCAPVLRSNEVLDGVVLPAAPVARRACGRRGIGVVDAARAAPHTADAEEGSAGQHQGSSSHTAEYDAASGGHAGREKHRQPTQQAMGSKARSPNHQMDGGGGAS